MRSIKGCGFRCAFALLTLAGIFQLFCAPAKAGGDLFGIVEVGASGVKASVFQITRAEARAIEEKFSREKDEVDFKYNLVTDREKKEPVYKEKETDVFLEKNIDATVQGAEDFVELMYNDYSVDRNDVFLVISSGVGRIKHIDELKRRLEEKTKIAPDVITSDAECTLGYRWVTPPYRYDEAVFLDIGSGNAKGCYVENAGKSNEQFRGFELLSVGTKTFTKQVKDELTKTGLGFTEFARMTANIAATKLEPELEQKIQTYPGLLKRNRYYFAGGIAFASTALVRPDRAKDKWVKISVNDFRTLNNRAVKGRPFEVNFSNVPEGDGVRKLAEENLARIQNEIFKEKERILAGTQLLISISTKLRLEKKALFFAAVSRDGWRSQYLIDRIAAIDD